MCKENVRLREEKKQAKDFAGLGVEPQVCFILRTLLTQFFDQQPLNNVCGSAIPIDRSEPQFLVEVFP